MPRPSPVVLLDGVEEERACGLDAADAEEGGGEGRAAVDQVEGVDVGVEDSLGFVVEDAGDAGEGDERGFVGERVDGFDDPAVEFEREDGLWVR
jgi:hypothetical protein